MKCVWCKETFKYGNGNSGISTEFYGTYRLRFQKYKLCPKCISDIKTRLATIPNWTPDHSDLFHLLLEKKDFERARWLLLRAKHDFRFQDDLTLGKTNLEERLKCLVESYLGLPISSYIWAIFWHHLKPSYSGEWAKIDRGETLDRFDVFSCLAELYTWVRDILPEMTECYNRLGGSDSGIELGTIKSTSYKSKKIPDSELLQFLRNNTDVNWTTKRYKAMQEHPNWRIFPTGDAMRKYCKRHGLC